MPTNRTPIGRGPINRITPKALAAHRRFIAAKDEDEYSDARVELTLALGRAPWQYDVLAAATDEPPAYMKEP
jgi:hypothetical protein